MARKKSTPKKGKKCKCSVMAKHRKYGISKAYTSFTPDFDIPFMPHQVAPSLPKLKSGALKIDKAPDKFKYKKGVRFI